MQKNVSRKEYTMLNNSIILNADSYKASHFCQYPPETEYLSSYIESRGGKYPFVLFFGLQAFIAQYLSKPITQQDIQYAKEIWSQHGEPFFEAGWQYILDHHGGNLPIRIEAVKEGLRIPSHQVLAQVSNTDPKVFWLTSYIETALLRAIWYPSTVATTSWVCKHIIAQYLEKTATSTDGLLFKLHDFGARGVSSFESASLGGMAHLVNFLGTDTISGVLAARLYYDEPMAGFSIPAAEHSTVVAWGRNHEEDAYRCILKEFAGKDKLVAVVSDSYNIYEALSHLWGERLKPILENQGGTVIIRLDSGDPVEVVIRSLTLLKEKFGANLNQKGYFELPPYLRVIQGDGISPSSIEAILQAMVQNRFSADNIAFGMGGELLQKINRDTLRFAMKVSGIRRKGESIWNPVYKDPQTDQTKRSKPGRLALIQNEHNQYQTILETELENKENKLEMVFENGNLMRKQTFKEIRELSW